jgi:uncharacterized protein YgbK (DUF1537 family)
VDGRLRVIADDLTGACDVAAALLPMPSGIVVENPSRWMAATATGDDGPLVVRNTQSRTLAPPAAAARVRAALARSAGWSGIVLKKIDTGLRGPLGAELDAAMDAVGADMALVLPAIPEAGRATVGGRQLADGVPVHETAFARDPHNPVADCRVAAVIEATSRRRAASVGLEALRREGVAGVLARARADGVSTIVGDAETDADLARWLDDLDGWMRPHAGEAQGRSLVVAGSTGVARALRARGGESQPGRRAPVAPPAKRTVGALVVAGSAHPATTEQLAHAERCGLVQLLRIGRDAPAAGAVVARALAGGHVAVVSADGALEALAEATRIAVERTPPCALVLVGGETAFRVLGALGDPGLWIERSPAPLAVCATILDGPLAGTPLVTKGGSTGPPERLAMLVEEAAR